MNSYEQLRYNNIKRNQEFLDSLSISNDVKVNPSVADNIKIKKRPTIIIRGDATRKSQRLCNNNIQQQEHHEVINEDKNNTLFSPPEIKVQKLRINSISLRQYIAKQNQEHNDLITDLVTYSSSLLNNSFLVIIILFFFRI
jgi:hypothetical protein